MKTNYIILFLLLSLFVSNPGVAQIELPEGTTKALEKYNKEQKEKETPDEGENAKQTEKEKAWEKMWEEDKEAFSEAASYFDTKALNCVFLSILYLDGYIKLMDLTDSEKNSQMKCDLLGMQAVAIGMSTMILYCPEYLAGLSYSEFVELVYEPIQAMGKDKDTPDYVQLWHSKFTRMMERFMKENYPLDDGPLPVDMQDFIVRFFRPQYIVSRSLDIAREMEARGCDDY
jgi:hypothetical protein